MNARKSSGDGSGSIEDIGGLRVRRWSSQGTYCVRLGLLLFATTPPMGLNTMGWEYGVGFGVECIGGYSFRKTYMTETPT
jgi:hypothetical protein